MGTKAGILLRLSEEKDRPELTAEAFERFEAKCRALCDRRDWTVVEVFNDGIVSAYKGKRRKGFDAAMVALQDGDIDVLVAPEPERLCRGWKDALTLDSALKASDGRTVVTADGRDISKDPYWPVLVGIAIVESNKISKRVTEQMAQAASKGRPAQGPRAYGYEPGGWAIRESEAAVIREAYRRLLAHEQMYAIVRDFRARGLIGARGELFTSTSLRNVLTNPRIAALRQRDGAEVKGKWPEIISAGDFRKVRGLFAKRAEAHAKGKRPGRGQSYVYSGLLVCGKCGAKLAGSSGAYRCQSCRENYISAAHLEPILGEAIIQWMTGDDFAERVSRRLEALQANDTTAEDLERDRAELAKYEATPAEILALVPGGAEHMAELKARVQVAETRLAAAPDLATLLDTPTIEAELRKAWASWTVEQKRARLAAVLDHVIIRPATRRRFFDPGRVEPPVWK